MQSTIAADRVLSEPGAAGVADFANNADVKLAVQTLSSCRWFR